MLDQLSSWLYPKPTGDPGHDRNARTVQFACSVFACAVSFVAILRVVAQHSREVPLLAFTIAALAVAMGINRAGRWAWAARTAFFALLCMSVLMVFDAHDGLRSNVMLLFPGILLLSIMLLDRASY